MRPRFHRPLTAIAALLCAIGAAPAGAATQVAQVNANVVKPLTIIWVQDLDLGTVVLAPGAWSGATIQRWRNLLHADRQHPPLPVDWQVSWDGRAPLPLPGGGMLRLRGAPRFDAPLQVGARRGGERILLGGRAHSHSLKHVLQDLAVPPWQRARLPLLSDAGGRLLAVAGLVNAAEFDAWLRSNGAELSFDSN